jgi:uncharacterized Zn-binding protein involved in type VI secretion
MPGIVREGDLSNGVIEQYIPSPTIEGSPNVKVNGKAAIRVGDRYADHSHIPPPGGTHTNRLAETGDSTVRINGSPAHRIFDMISGGRTETVVTVEEEEFCAATNAFGICQDYDTRITTTTTVYFYPCNDIAQDGSANVIAGGSMSPPTEGGGPTILSQTQTVRIED